MDEKETLHRYLKRGRAGLLFKLDGLDEYDIRRPMTRTGTNLLGLVKHVASVELGYFTDCFGRPTGRPMPWIADGAEPDADMWATAEETREEIIELHHFAAEHSDAVISELDLDATGEVPWWPEERRTVTLHQLLVHMVTETAQHAGHADIIRELIDGAVGQRPNDDNHGHRDTASWADLCGRIEAAARQAGGRT